MAKKKNPEQETENPTEEQVQEPDDAEVDDPQQEQPQDETEQEPEDQEDDGQEDRPEDPADEPEDAPAQEPAAGDNTNLQRDLIQARGELAAYRAGVAPAMVQDAVTLAMAEAEKSGEITEAAVSKALEAVLKRHPEWKSAEEPKQKSGGFRLGADRDSGGSYKKTTGNNQNVKRWNRYKNT